MLYRVYINIMKKLRKSKGRLQEEILMISHYKKHFELYLRLCKI